MTREEALYAIANGTSHSRFTALGVLERVALPTDIELLMKLQTTEADLYVKKRIERVVSKLHKNLPEKTEVDDDIVPAEVKRKVRADAIEWVAGLLLHEIGSKLGLLASEISQDVPNFESSNSMRRIEQLQDTFDGIEQLKKATSSPKPIEMDLSEFIRDSVEVERIGRDVEASYVGISPLIIFCDRGLLGLALCNGIKNAMEAAMSVRSEVRAPMIVVSWGQTDKDNWITIIDNGPGLPSSSARSFVLGESSKSGHLGFGLGIARQAIETLHGSVELRNSGADGAAYELRWSLTN
ncbi:ATP-binding protein [Pseudomonas putida]|uniref:ATP-binding protein n=1 Tax=Pseudomonas putida TaxID=303 RepID=UPI0009BFAD8C|nr:ATP-binding protein [Pseudomonas putida]